MMALSLGILVPPGSAQQADKVWRIGFLGDGAAAQRVPISLEPFRQGLRELGYVEGRNVILEVRWTDGNNERLAEFAREFVRLDVDVIVTHGAPGSFAAKAATARIPIVVAVTADMVGVGLVASLSRPGGNVTGMTDQVTELSGKQVQLLKELLPDVKRVAVLANRTNPAAARTSEATETAARQLGLQVRSLEVRSLGEIEPALDAAARGRAGAVVVAHDPLTVNHRARIARLAVAKRLPIVSASTLFAEAGGLMSYGPDLARFFRRAAVFVDRILKGAKPSDIPVEQPTQFDLFINLRTARALGVTIPPALLRRADRVIE